MNSLFVFVAVLASSGCYAQRVAPGVPPQHYQQNQGPPMHQGGHPDPHQQQMQYQQQQQAYQQPQQHQVDGRVPPGVHPGQYQPGQQPPQQQFQQQPPQQQFQQQPPQQQFQQPPPQHHQQNVPHQQQHAPQHQQPHHQPQVLNPNNIQHEREHIAEHAEVPIDTSKMSEQELQFHYFKMHDADSNNKLDGCELIKSLIHYHEQGSKESHNHGGDPEAQRVEEKIFSDEELVALIDPILQMDDINKDGFIDYPEFIRAQQKAQQKH